MRFGQRPRAIVALKRRCSVQRLRAVAGEPKPILSVVCAVPSSRPRQAPRRRVASLGWFAAPVADARVCSCSTRATAPSRGPIVWCVALALPSGRLTNRSSGRVQHPCGRFALHRSGAPLNSQSVRRSVHRRWPANAEKAFRPKTRAVVVHLASPLGRAVSGRWPSSRTTFSAGSARSNAGVAPSTAAA